MAQIRKDLSEWYIWTPRLRKERPKPLFSFLDGWRGTVHRSPLEGIHLKQFSWPQAGGVPISATWLWASVTELVMPVYSSQNALLLGLSGQQPDQGTSPIGNAFLVMGCAPPSPPVPVSLLFQLCPDSLCANVEQGGARGEERMKSTLAAHFGGQSRPWVSQADQRKFSCGRVALVLASCHGWFCRLNNPSPCHCPQCPCPNLGNLWICHHNSKRDLLLWLS